MTFGFTVNDTDVQRKKKGFFLMEISYGQISLHVHSVHDLRCLLILVYPSVSIDWRTGYPGIRCQCMLAITPVFLRFITHLFTLFSK